MSALCIGETLLEIKKINAETDLKSVVGSHYEEYLGAKFPYGTYKQVFIAPEMAVFSMSIGASMSIFSSDILYDEKIIDKV